MSEDSGYQRVMDDADSQADAVIAATEKYINSGLPDTVLIAAMDMLAEVHEENKGISAAWGEDSALSAIATMRKGMQEDASAFRIEFQCQRLELKNDRLESYKQAHIALMSIIEGMKTAMLAGDEKRAYDHQMTLISCLDDEVGE